MFENRHEPLASTSKFVCRLVLCFMIGLALIFVGLLIGMVGYHFTENMPWEEAFVNAALILSDMGPVSPLSTTSGKIFAAFYALFSGLAFISIVGIIFAPIIHRFLHKFHLDGDDS